MDGLEHCVVKRAYQPRGYGGRRGVSGPSALHRRQLTLPGEVKPEDVKASFEDGVLTVRVPRAPKPQPVKVAITAGS
jgi:hypothetical protein